jgi:hypothetical protein
VALDEYLRAVQRARRVGQDPPLGRAEAEIDPARARRHRLRASHADRRLPPGSYADAARGGLQDSAPRAALVGLHARVEDVPGDAWEHPDLVQIWFRGADYVVPRADVGVFTRGALPRHRPWADALDALGDAIAVAAAGSDRTPSRVVQSRLRTRAPVRLSSPSGRVHIRWDARLTEIVIADRPAIDVAAARRELARRFLHVHGPAGPRHLARWAGLTAADAEATWHQLEDDGELAPVAFGGRQRWLLRDDVDPLLDGGRPTGVRLLPQGDEVLHMGDDGSPPPPTIRPRPAEGITTRLINSLTGRIVLDGDVVGAWGRVRGAFTAAPSVDVGAETAGAIEDEACSLVRTVGFPLRFRWIGPGPGRVP